MGADGGTIPKRCELVKAKKKVDKIDKATKNATKWRNCQLSQAALRRPIIACRYGRLYNKDAVIEAILSKTISQFVQAAHIKSTKDFKELRLTDNKDFKDGNMVVGESGTSDLNQSPFLCPVTSLPMNGSYPFVANWHCGCVFSEKAVQEVKSDVCHVCGGPYDKQRLVQLNPDDEALEKIKEKIAEERRLRKEAKSDATGGVGAAARAKVAELKESEGERRVDKRKLIEAAAAISGTSGPPAVAAQSSSSSSTTTDSDARTKKPRPEATANSAIQNDPAKSKAYKSLFTTCEAAQNKPKAHWVTHNPLFY